LRAKIKEHEERKVTKKDRERNLWKDGKKRIKEKGVSGAEGSKKKRQKMCSGRERQL